MIVKVLGKKRVFILGFLASLNLVLGLWTYFYLQPRAEKEEKKNKALETEVLATETEAEQLRAGFIQIKDLFPYYQILKDDLNFFSARDLSVARDVIGQFTKTVGLTYGRYEVDPAAVEENKPLEEAEYAILKTPVTIRIGALDDLDIYGFLTLIRTDFPGHVALKRITILRENPFNEAALRKIGVEAAEGAPTHTLLNAKIELDWRNVVPKDQIRDTVGPGQARR